MKTDAVIKSGLSCPELVKQIPQSSKQKVTAWDLDESNRALQTRVDGTGSTAGSLVHEFSLQLLVSSDETDLRRRSCTTRMKFLLAQSNKILF
jgi:hypothetical protein